MREKRKKKLGDQTKQRIYIYPIGVPFICIEVSLHCKRRRKQFIIKIVRPLVALHFLGSRLVSVYNFFFFVFCVRTIHNFCFNHNDRHIFFSGSICICLFIYYSYTAKKEICVSARFVMIHFLFSL